MLGAIKRRFPQICCIASLRAEIQNSRPGQRAGSGDDYRPLARRPVWIRSPAAAPRSSTTKCDDGSAGLKCTTQEWIDVHLAAHKLGMRTTATMMFAAAKR